MLSKIVGISAVLILFMIPSAADAHNRHRPRIVHKPAPTVVVTLGWTWVEASLFKSAHWHHPHYGRSYRPLVNGPPPARPHDHAIWVAGHWEGRHRHRIWVPGHWKVI